jgi:hypothetical protein
MVQSDPFTSIAALPDAAKTDRSFTLMPLFRAPADASPQLLPSCSMNGRWAR